MIEVIPLENNEGKNVILFDGVCNVCNGWVKFVLQRDLKSRGRWEGLIGEENAILYNRICKSS